MLFNENEIASESPQFLRDFAEFLNSRSRHRDALRVCELALQQSPNDLASLLLAARSATHAGDLDGAFERLMTVKSLGLGNEPAALEETLAVLQRAVPEFEDCMAKGRLARTEAMADAMVALCPGLPMLLGAQLRARMARSADYQKKTFDSLLGLASCCHEKADFDAEASFRLQLFHHPADSARPSAVRLDNIFLAISQILTADRDFFDEARIDTARMLLSAAAAIPPSPMPSGSFHDDSLARYDRFYRLLLGSIDLDVIFGPPTPPQPLLPLSFYSVSGTPMDMAAIAGLAAARGARAAFFTASSPEYFSRFATSYAASILEYADTESLIFICICTRNEVVQDVISAFSINDPRVIFCCDGFDINARTFRLYGTAKGDASPVPIYYGYAALLRVDHLLTGLGLPVIVTGIDTILQRGIADLMDEFAGSDVVLNKAGSKLAIGAQIVNNLSITYPTENGMLFIQFLKRYSLEHLAWSEQPEFLDQLDIHMAKNHVFKNGHSPVIRYFAPLDINNVMFDRGNYEAHIDYLKSFRFLNIFAEGRKGNALRAEDVYEAAAE